jgi:TonB family protein
MAKFMLFLLVCFYTTGFLSCAERKSISNEVDKPVVKMPQLLIRVDGFYPPLAQAAGIEGIVGIKLWIDEVGKVDSAKIPRSSGSNAGFEQVCLAAGEKSLWIPAYSKTGPVPHWSYYEVVFVCRWKHVQMDKDQNTENSRYEQFQQNSSDSLIEIHEVYDTPPTIEITQMPEYLGEGTPKDDTGYLWIRTIIEGSGRVRSAAIVQSSLTDQELEEALIRAFYGYSFKPATSNDETVAVQVEFEIVFAPRSEVIRCY